MDQEVGDRILRFVPALPRSAVADRAFLSRAVRHLAGAEGIRQFPDIGTGLPTADNTHEVAQRVGPTCRIVHADNDPLVLALLGILNVVLDTDEAVSLLHRPLDAVPSGSFLAVSHPTTEVDGEAERPGLRAHDPARPRPRPASSTGSGCWGPAWSPAPAGGPRPVSRSRRRSPTSARWAASPGPAP
ncbi:SAM-dependent methyltransferase [Streptomyces achromogenes]|uniref:SAM-dependent methyltransferase n=1 Tax=Streptomyces achromogenes TaxID=67255 RepID=UPI003673C64F